MKHAQQAPPGLRFLEGALAGLEREGLLRVPGDPPRRPLTTYCSNDYLDLADVPASSAASGSGASRLVSGDRAEHRALERALAEWLQTEDSLVFTSGYAANVGVISALAAPEDLIVSDALNHASLIDGARLSRANVVVVRHLDVDAVRRALAAPRGGRAWVITESYFSMDADGPDLRALRSACDEGGAALVVDEAHAVGVLGPDGRGRSAEAAVVPDVLIGTFGKAFGGSGAFVAGCGDLRSWLWNRARSFVFSTGLAPSAAGSALRALTTSRAEPARRAAAAARADELRAGLRALGISPLGFGHIVPWVVGDPQTAVRYARALTERGAHVQAIRPPSVPRGTARLRLTVTAAHSKEDVSRLLTEIEDVVRCEGR